MNFLWRLRVAGIFLLGVAVAGPLAARPFTVMVYNVENLIDADDHALFEEYQPAKYTRNHVLTKLQNIASVLARIDEGRGPDVILFAEIEVDQTPAAGPADYDALLRPYARETVAEMLGSRFDPAVADLPAEALLAKACTDRGLNGYRVITAEEPLAAGERPPAQKCVIFSRLPVKSYRVLRTAGGRPILEALLEVDGAPVYVFDNHWKSGASDPAMERARIKSARTLRERIDEILREDPHADIIVGGDFNAQYNQSVRYAKTMTHTAINDVLGSEGDGADVRASGHGLYNLWYELPPGERGSDTYHGEWGTLIQLLVSRGLFDYRGVQYVDGSMTVAKYPDLNMEKSGLPRRWSFSGPGGSGFSDHFPIYARFTTVTDGDANRTYPARPVVEEPAPAPEPEHIRPAIDVVAAAVSTAQVPPATDIRQPEFVGKIFRVEGPVGKGTRLTVEFRGEVYDVWSFDAALRKRLRAAHRAGETIRFYGELGQYKGHWQFVIRDESWVK